LEVTIKFYLYQVLAIGGIWVGMTFFVSDMTDTGKIIYYTLTIWLVFLIIFTIRKWFADRKTKMKDEP